jgi:cell division protein FtsW
MGFAGEQQLVEPTASRRHRPDYLLIVYVLILMALGAITIFAVGPQHANLLNNAIGSNYSNDYFFIKQLVSLGLSLLAFVAAATIPYKFFLRYGGILLVIGLAACLLLFFAQITHLGIAQCTLGACRWFNLGALGSLQPAEILKFGLLVYLAAFLGAKMQKGDVDNIKQTLLPVAWVTGLGLLFVAVIQKDLGTAISMAMIVLVMLVVSGVRWRVLAAVLAAGLLIGLLFIVSEPHRLQRVETYLQGDRADVNNASNYQSQNAKIALGTGWWLGLGVGNSIQATGYLPEAINDSVFAIMGEMFGFIGVSLVIVLFVALLMRILRIMDHLVDQRLKLLAAGVFGWLGAHVILNIAAMIGVIPLTGITLPLLSFGGTIMLFIAAGIDLVFQLSGYTIYSPSQKEETNEGSRGRRGVGRTRYASRRGA